jgi:hypothetical protein
MTSYLLLHSTHHGRLGHYSKYFTKFLKKGDNQNPNNLKYSDALLQQDNDLSHQKSRRILLRGLGKRRGAKD